MNKRTWYLFITKRAGYTEITRVDSQGYHGRLVRKIPYYGLGTDWHMREYRDQGWRLIARNGQDYTMVRDY